MKPLYLLTFVIALAIPASLLAQDAATKESQPEKRVHIDTSMHKAIWPLKICGICFDEYAGIGETTWVECGNSLIPLCNDRCARAHENESEKACEKYKILIAQYTKDDYPLDVCFVDGSKLGTHGTPVDYVEYNELLRFCRPSCEEQYKSDPEKFIEKHDRLIVEKKQKFYPLNGCLFCRTPFTDEVKPVDFVYQNKYYQICGEQCVHHALENRADVEHIRKIAFNGVPRFNKEMEVKRERLKEQAAGAEKQ